MNYGYLFSNELQKFAADIDGNGTDDMSWKDFGKSVATIGGIGAAGGLGGALLGGRGDLPLGAKNKAKFLSMGTLKGMGHGAAGLGLGSALAVPFLAGSAGFEDGGLAQHLFAGAGAGALTGGLATGMIKSLGPEAAPWMKYRSFIPAMAGVGAGLGALEYAPPAVGGGLTGALAGGLGGGLAASLVGSGISKLMKRPAGFGSTPALVGAGLGALGGGVYGATR